MRFKMLLSLFMFFIFEKTKCFNAYFITSDNAVFDMGSGDHLSSEDFLYDNSESEAGITRSLTTDTADTDFQTVLWSPPPDVCKPEPKGRVPWILHMRDSNYGWNDHTHRAVIALAVNDYRGNEVEMKKTELELEGRLTLELLKNKTDRMRDSDLVLYIHALLATNKNPRNFYGTDFVADLLHRIEISTGKVNPFLILALCNSHTIQSHHFMKLISIFLYNRDSHETQSQAAALMAVACAAEVNNSLNILTNKQIHQIVNKFRPKYNKEKGSFGNVYATSLAVQALSASKKVLNASISWWDEAKSLKYLEQESEIDVNIIKAYYIEMALNARRYKFIKDIHKKQHGTKDYLQSEFYVQYTIMKFPPDMYFTCTLKVPDGTTVYDVMKMAANDNTAFNFTHYLNKDGDPEIYSIARIPNDAEENMFWRLCKHFEVNHDRHASRRIAHIAHDESPVRIMAKKDDHWIYIYSNSDCPSTVRN